MDFISLALFTVCVIVIFRVLLIVHYQYDIRQKLKNIPQVDSFPLGATLETMSLSPDGKVFNAYTFLLFFCTSVIRTLLKITTVLFKFI